LLPHPTSFFPLPLPSFLIPLRSHFDPLSFNYLSIIIYYSWQKAVNPLRISSWIRVPQTWLPRDFPPSFFAPNSQLANCAYHSRCFANHQHRQTGEIHCAASYPLETLKSVTARHYTQHAAQRVGCVVVLTTLASRNILLRSGTYDIIQRFKMLSFHNPAMPPDR
jgi:hypothetical protein